MSVIFYISGQLIDRNRGDNEVFRIEVRRQDSGDRAAPARRRRLAHTLTRFQNNHVPSWAACLAFRLPSVS